MEPFRLGYVVGLWHYMKMNVWQRNGEKLLLVAVRALHLDRPYNVIELLQLLAGLPIWSFWQISLILLWSNRGGSDDDFCRLWAGKRLNDRGDCESPP